MAQQHCYPHASKSMYDKGLPHIVKRHLPILVCNPVSCHYQRCGSKSASAPLSSRSSIVSLFCAPSVVSMKLLRMSIKSPSPTPALFACGVMSLTAFHVKISSLRFSSASKGVRSSTKLNENLRTRMFSSAARGEISSI